VLIDLKVGVGKVKKREEEGAMCNE